MIVDTIAVMIDVMMAVTATLTPATSDISTGSLDGIIAQYVHVSVVVLVLRCLWHMFTIVFGSKHMSKHVSQAP